MQKDRESIVSSLPDKYERTGPEYLITDMVGEAYDAGYAQAVRDAVKKFEFGSTFRRLDIVEAIRTLNAKEKNS